MPEESKSIFSQMLKIMLIPSLQILQTRYQCFNATARTATEECKSWGPKGGNKTREAHSCHYFVQYPWYQSKYLT